MLCLLHIQHKVNAITKTITFQGLLHNFVNNHIRLIRSRGLAFVKGLHDFWLEAIHDGLQLSDVDATRDLRALSYSIQKSCLGAWRKLLAKLNNPPLTCIVSDGLTTFTIKAAKELRIPEVQFYATSVFGFMAHLSFGELIQKGLVPFKGYFPSAIKSEMILIYFVYIDMQMKWKPILDVILPKLSNPRKIHIISRRPKSNFWFILSRMSSRRVLGEPTCTSQVKSR